MTTPGTVRSTLLCAVVALLAPRAAAAQSLPTAAQVVERIGVGWNIGNTMEVPGGETGWGNPAVTRTLIDGVKAAGFDAVRIPCAWDSHANATTHQIDASWLARVKEVVDACVANGMYVVLNIHWDGGWLENHPLYADQQAVNDKQRTYWTQIATFFRSYDEHLLFAGTNEVHADYGTPTAEHITVQESYNQTFVDAVRATGGNNATRPLVVQTYNTNIGHGLTSFTPPRDTATDRLVVEVHYYDPFDYTGNASGSCPTWGSPFPAQSACAWAQESYLDDQMSKVNAKWVARGVPVIVGEYGPMRRTSLSGQQLADHLASRRYYLKYLNAAAARNGIKTFYWDNGVWNDGGQIIDRTTGAVSDQGAVDAILQGAGIGSPTAEYTLTTSTAGAGTVTRSPSATTYRGGTSVTLTATPAAGAEFAGWSGDLGGLTNPATVKVRGNLSVVASFVPAGTRGTGQILRESWSTFTGSGIAGLRSDPRYPGSPTGTELLTSLEGPVNAGDGYGARLRGWLHPPVTGAYTFWISADDDGELWLGTSDDPASAARIAYTQGYTNPHEWTRSPSQRSAAVDLTAGKKYYVEVLQVEAGGGDHVSVAWMGPGIPQAVIGGPYLSPFPSGSSGGGSSSGASSGGTSSGGASGGSSSGSTSSGGTSGAATSGGGTSSGATSSGGSTSGAPASAFSGGCSSAGGGLSLLLPWLVLLRAGACVRRPLSRG